MDARITQYNPYEFFLLQIYIYIKNNKLHIKTNTNFSTKYVCTQKTIFFNFHKI